MESPQDLIELFDALDRLVELVPEVLSREVHGVERVGLHHLVHRRCHRAVVTQRRTSRTRFGAASPQQPTSGLRSPACR